MGNHGNSIPCPLSQAINKRSRKTKGNAEIELDEINRLEDEWADKRCTKLRKVILNPPLNTNEASTSNETNNLEVEDENTGPASPNHFNLDYNMFPDEDDPPPSPSENESDASEENDEVVRHITSVSYQQRRVREELQWRQNLTPMFVAFMEASKMTLQWGTASWNIDWKPECGCSTAKKRTRPVDVVDIFSMYQLVLILMYHN
ncbi:uncharacterized protein MELLADRAFT_62070 [Melampsora larici-populina 98AG31]|uniref:CxC1-like cysteine cluster associated with KDZ transposases domain-containing protein n=1 Tax=Melampsora larici-populina (strain 98AG31 / pathotype 3-4-7) TaxID=747676 RepID=F4RHA7_MELLP|nr:uncharacterized protein MELLADRAFT_62070 [Melampsora larici-populina 98AG31]EGG08236.1 hypothetical protein MELLADRAFT_62070 [Melampsora larici-populina 98AG31]